MEYQNWISSMNIIDIPVIEIDTTNYELNSSKYDDLVNKVCFEICRYKKLYGSSEMADEVNVKWDE